MEREKNGDVVVSGIFTWRRTATRDSHRSFSKNNDNFCENNNKFEIMRNDGWQKKEPHPIRTPMWSPQSALPVS